MIWSICDKVFFLCAQGHNHPGAPVEAGPRNGGGGVWWIFGQRHCDATVVTKDAGTWATCNDAGPGGCPLAQMAVLVTTPCAKGQHFFQ